MRLADAAAGDDAPLREVVGHAGLDEWLAAWRGRTGEGAAEALRAANPLYIPRNHLVEEAISAAYADDFAPFETLVAVLEHPFEEQVGAERYALPAAPEEAVMRTFRGT